MLEILPFLFENSEFLDYFITCTILQNGCELNMGVININSIIYCLIESSSMKVELPIRHYQSQIKMYSQLWGLMHLLEN